MSSRTIPHLVAAGLAGLAILSVAGAQENSSTGWATTSGSFSITQTKSCWIASIADVDKAVTIDWECVRENAQRYRDGKAAGYTDAISHILQAIRDGQAKEKGGR